MNQDLKKIAIPGLRWTLGVVVLLESLHFVFSPIGLPSVRHTGFSNGFRWALGGSETIAVLLFLLPAAGAIGGYLLMAVFAVAIAAHLHHGEFNVGFLVVYGMAALVCSAHRGKQAGEEPDDRR